MSILAGNGINVKRNSESKLKVSTKYFCEVTGNEAKICMQLESHGDPEINRPPHCWVVVIDVSASMGKKGKDGMTMLDRVKTFVGLATKIIPDRDFMSIVSFSSSALTELNVTRMNLEGKQSMLSCLNALEPKNNTNVEAGLAQGMVEILRARRDGILGENTTKSIIIFTDGCANEGTRNGTALVSLYQNTERSMGTNTRIPLSAFTVGNQRPTLLEEMSYHLGSEAFYWLDESQDFEADMLMPFVLRKLSVVNNVQVLIKTMNSALIIGNTEEQIVDKSLIHLEYFVHMLPLGWPKVFQVNLRLPNLSLAQQRGLEILDVATTFCDEAGNEMHLHDRITLTGQSVFEALALSQADRQITQTLRENEFSGESLQRSKVLQETSSFIYVDDNHLTSWQTAKKVILLHAKLEILQSLLTVMRQPGIPTAQDNALALVDRIKERVELIIDNSDDREYGEWVEEIQAVLPDICNALELGSSHKGLGRLASMTSALAMNMPAPKGVFHETCKWNGTALTKDIGKLLRDAKESLRHVANDTGSFRALQDKLEEEQFATRLVDLKENFAKTLQDAKNALKPTIGTTYENNLFRGYLFILSHTLRWRDDYVEKVKIHHGVSEESLTSSNGSDQVYVVMESDGATTDSILFVRATEMKVPIVKPTFIDACIKQDQIIVWFRHAVKAARRLR